MISTDSSLNEEEIELTVRDAASVVLVRDGEQGIEAFMLRRGGSSTVMNDAYVFPGGKVDPEDGEEIRIERYGRAPQASRMLGEPGLNESLAVALFVAACRETFEETGVELQVDQLTPLSRWITPKVPAMMRKRFDTRFFVARLPFDSQAIHDGVEADASEWYAPRVALLAYCDRRIALAPPQIMTLAGMARYASAQDAIDDAANGVPSLIEPHTFKDPASGSRAMAYPGDPLHPVTTRAMPGPTRLIWREGRFEPPDGFDSFFA